MSEKGNGLQRALCLSLIQVFAAHSSKGSRPFFLFIDEPEISYHPQAQRKLLKAFLEIGTYQQIFINTHSPYFISPQYIENTHRTVFGENGTKVLSVLNVFNEKEREIHSTDIREIFFAENILCVEGQTDVSNFGSYIDLSDITLIKMRGCGELSKYWKSLNAFNFNFKIILDVDVLHKESGVFKNFDKEVHDLILDLDIVHRKNDASNFFDENLTDEKRIKKYAIIEKLKLKKIYVLPNGMIEDYFKNGEIVSKDREAEIVEILS